MDESFAKFLNCLSDRDKSLYILLRAYERDGKSSSSIYETMIKQLDTINPIEAKPLILHVKHKIDDPFEETLGQWCSSFSNEEHDSEEQ